MADHTGSNHAGRNHADRDPIGHTQHTTRSGGDARDTTLCAYGFDAVELSFLSLCRRVFEAVAGGNPQGWAAARATATGAYGPGCAEAVLNATLEVVDAMRRLRGTAFNYRKDGCACCRNRVTPEERLLVSTYHNLRRGKRSRAYVQAMLLVEGQEPAALLVALEMLDYTLFELGKA